MSIDEARFHATMKAYMDASKHFSDASIARFVVLNDPTRTPVDMEEVGQSHDDAARELAHCLERVNVMLDELEARPEHEAAEAEEQAKLDELRSMAEADSEVRGERIDTEPDAVHDAKPGSQTRSPVGKLGRTGNPPEE